METTRDYKDHVGIILGLYRGYIGIMEKKMETALMPINRTDMEPSGHSHAICFY